MPLTESEEAQYNAMQTAFIESQETIQRLRLEKKVLEEKLETIVTLIRGEDE